MKLQLVSVEAVRKAAAGRRCWCMIVLTLAPTAGRSQSC